MLILPFSRFGFVWNISAKTFIGAYKESITFLKNVWD